MSQYSSTAIAPYRKKKLFNRYFADVTGPILDIGCSVGTFLQHAPERITGIDIDTEALEKARSLGFHCVEANIEEGLPFEEGHFAAVNCDSVLEHVHNPVAFMHEINRVLAVGGKLVLVTPDILRMRHRFWRDYTHIHPFCPQSLKHLAEDTGFRNCKVRRYSLNYLRVFAPLIPAYTSPAVWLAEDMLDTVIGYNSVLVAIK